MPAFYTTAQGIWGLCGIYIYGIYKAVVKPEMAQVKQPTHRDVAAERVRRGLTQAQVAAVLPDITQPDLSKIETGKLVLSAEQYEQILDAIAGLTQEKIGEGN